MKPRGRRPRLAFLLRLVAVLAAAGGFLAPVATPAYIDEGPSPDLAAWEVFAETLAPAGAPNERRLEFETWASDEDIYLQSPPRWPEFGARAAPGDCRQDFDHNAAMAAGLPHGA